MSVINSIYYTKSIEQAVKHPLWSLEEQVCLISRHNARILKQEADRHPAAGKHLELTEQ